MKSGPLTKPPGSLCDNEQLFCMSLRILEWVGTNEDFYWNLIQKYRESQVIIRLDLVSLISPLLSYGFWSNLVPTESSFQGASNATYCERLEEELAEDVGYYWKLTRWSRSRILVPSFLGTSILVARPSTLAVLLQF